MLASQSSCPVGERIVNDRRRLRRVETTCNALIRLSAALTFRCVVRNLSMNAAQVQCEPRYALLVSQARPLELSIAFPVDGAVRGFTARCRVKYCESLAEEAAIGALEMVLGLEFVDLEAGTRQLLAGYLGAFPD